MDHSFRRRDVLQRKLRVLNQKEDRTLQQKLYMLDKQHRYTHKMLQQRQELLLREHRRVVMVKVCEPKATVNIAMKEIEEHQIAAVHCRGVRTSEGRRFCPSESPVDGSEPEERSRSISAPPLPPNDPAGQVRRRGTIQSSVSLMQMKNIATIDSISEKELVMRQQKAQEELERLRQFQREALQNRVAAFIERLKDRSNMYTGSYEGNP